MKLIVFAFGGYRPREVVESSEMKKLIILSDRSKGRIKNFPEKIPLFEVPIAATNCSQQLIGNVTLATHNLNRDGLPWELGG